MEAKEYPEVTPSHGHNQSIATYGSFPSGKHLKTRWTTFYNRASKDRVTWVGEAKTQTYKPCTPSHKHNREESHQTGTSPRRVRYWCSALGTPAPGICTGKMSSQYIWLGKPTGEMSRSPKVPWETEVLLLESSHVVSLTPRPNENIAWKVLRLYVRVIYLLI